VAVLPILPNGLFEKVQNIVFEEGSGHVKGRQESGHAHSTTFSPDGKYLYASDLEMTKSMHFVITRTRLSHLKRIPTAM
jgi:6-phosphogluconolactonase (cycloisomerase 2 family)